MDFLHLAYMYHFDEGVRRELMARILLGKFGEPEDVADTEMITDHILLVDDGWTAQ